MRLVHLDCRATIGQVGNIEHGNVHVGKAGRTRWMGRRPHNRGVTMNPVDHPMGGGEGRSSGGRHPCSPWGKPTKGYKTRENKRTDGMIVKRRGKKAKEVSHGSFSQEGSVRRQPPHEEGGRDAADQVEEGHQDLVAPLDDHPRDGRPDVRRAQRPQVRAGVRDREHGRPQARRVRAHADVPRPLGRPQGRRPGPAPPRAAPRRAQVKESTSMARASPQTVPRVAPQGADGRGHGPRHAVDEAMSILAPAAAQGGARCCRKVLGSAVANADRERARPTSTSWSSRRHRRRRPGRKRWMPRSMGRANRILQPHVPRHRRRRHPE